MLGKKQIDQVDSFTYQGCIIINDSGCSVGVENILAKAQGVYFTAENSFED